MFEVESGERAPRTQNTLSVYCEVCVEEFSHETGRAPRLISCGHTFCESCLTKLQTEKPHSYRWAGSRRIVYTTKYEIICPTCKETTNLDKPCINSLPKNYAYLNLIEEVLENEKKKPEYCKEHPNYVVDMFCHDEEELTCLYCASYGDHKEHLVSRLAGFADHQRTSIKHRINTLEDINREYDELLSELESREEKITYTIENMRMNIVLKFDSIQTEIKRTLDAKLESVLNQLNEYSSVQLSLINDAKQTLDSQKFQNVQARATTFLSEAKESDIAKETGLIKDMQAIIDDVQSDMLCTEHAYEIRIDSSDHIVQSVKTLVDSWECCVNETKVPSFENVTTVVDRYSPSYGDSINILIGEKPPSEFFTENPFARIDCKLLCDGDLDFVC